MNRENKLSFLLQIVLANYISNDSKGCHKDIPGVKMLKYKNIQPIIKTANTSMEEFLRSMFDKRNKIP